MNYTPYEYGLCVDVDNNNKLVSFMIRYADEDANIENTFIIPRVGPAGGNCTAVRAPSREFPRAMRIYQDGEGISAVQILPKGENPKLFTLGKFDRETDDSETFNFKDNEDVLGFWGVQGD